MHLFNMCHVLGYCYWFLAPHSSSSCYLITVVLLLNPWDQSYICSSVRNRAAAAIYPLASMCPSPFAASLPWAHTAHPSHPPSECQSLPSLPKTPDLPFYPFLPTAAASDSSAKEGRRKQKRHRGNQCCWARLPFALCRGCTQGAAADAGPEHLSHPGSALCWDRCCKKLPGCAVQLAELSLWESTAARAEESHELRVVLWWMMPTH